MTKTTLTLSDEQLYEVYNAAWREFVCLHQQITTNPNGVSLAVLGRACESKMALGQVCDLIEAARPEWARCDARYVEARRQSATTDPTKTKH